MCSIAGGVWVDHSAGLENRLDFALSSIRYRGPNDQGSVIFSVSSSTVALGQTRLVVIDLSSGGHQLVWSQDRHYAIIFNGEIYSYCELRTELAVTGPSFVSDSDSEGLLHAWIRWGEGCLARLKGMFAFAIADLEAGTVTCVPDPFGIRPFYCESSSDGFLFASEQRGQLLAAFDDLIAGRRKFSWQVWRWVNYVRWYRLAQIGAQ